jgi:hypothetical protein
MRALSAAAAILLVAFAGAAHAAESSLRLVPLVERIARLHAQAGQGVMAQRSRKALGEAIREFDGALRAALAAAPGPEARENYVLLAMLWQDYRDWAQRPPTRETGRKLRDRTEEVAHVAAKGVRLSGDSPRAAVAGYGATRLAGGGGLAAHREGLPVAALGHPRRGPRPGAARVAREPAARARGDRRQRRGWPRKRLAQVQAAQTQWRFLADAATQLEKSNADARALEFACKAGDHILEALKKLY